MASPLPTLNAAEAADRRNSRRVRVTCPAVLETLTGDCTGQLWDMSEGGARLRLPLPPQIGATARLRWEGRMEVCTVVWSDGDMCGIAFERQIPEEVVTAAAELSREVELPIARVGNIAPGRKRSAGLMRGPSEETNNRGEVIPLPRPARNARPMAASLEMFLYGAPLAHVVAFQTPR